jgi:trimeric autotransporter adhesin
MKHHRIMPFLAAALAAVAIIRDSAGQCASNWLPGEGTGSVDGNGSVLDATTWDPDGPGPEQPLLVVCGAIWAAGDARVDGIAAWDGNTWRSLGTGAGGALALAVHNGQLIAAINGFPGGVGRFDPQTQSWLPLGAGLNHSVRDVTIYNGDLIAAGFFTAAGGQPANYVARWNGSAWSAVGSGLPGAVATLAVHNGALIGGSGLGVFRLSGQTWQRLGPTMSVAALTVYNGDLIAGGAFRILSGGPANHIARWDGQAWQPLGSGMSDHVLTLTTYNGDLIAGGLFFNAGGAFVLKLARWDGSSWSSVGGGGAAQVWSFHVHNNELIIGGRVPNFAGSAAAYLARWNGSSWNSFGSGFDDAVFAFAEFNGELYAGGLFSTARGIGARGLVKQNGDRPWEPVGAGLSGQSAYVLQLAVYNGSLIASGSFSVAGTSSVNGIARWDGQQWFPFATSGGGALFVHDGQLYTSGTFGASHVGRYSDGQWEPVGEMPVNYGVSDFTIYKGEIVAGGTAGSGAASCVFRWDGQAWHPIGALAGSINALEVYQNQLYAGGLSGLVRWTGAAWEALPGGLQPYVRDLRAHDGYLIVAGQFQMGFNNPIRHIARWNGQTWSALGLGIGMDGAADEDSVVALGAYKGELLAGGWFTMAGEQPNAYWARFGCDCYANCDNSTTAPILNVGDFTCFLQRFAAADPYANCDGSTATPVLNVGDFTCFLQRFAAGCP